ncbi:MAG: multidrug resistance efflux pump [Polaribacter sp.]|jgi:multidrug resistance efflux pump
MPESYIDNPSDIKLSRHDEVNQILGRPPGALLNYGIGCLVLFFGILIGLSFLIEYPDKIPARVEIITESPAIKVVARVSGKINKLLVSNNQQVQMGNIIGILENPASLEDIDKLDDLLNQLENSDKQKTLATPLLKNLQLGNVQFSYAALTQKINDLRYFKNSDDVDQKVKLLEKQISLKGKLSTNLERQKTILLQEIEINNINLKRNEKLHESEIVSTIEIEKLKTKALQLLRQLDMLENQMVNNDISKEEIKTDIIDFRQVQKDGSSGRQLKIEEELQRIKSEIALWKQNYLLIAPISGQVSFSNIFSEQQFVSANQEVLTIVPPKGNSQVMARALLPVANSGKVTTGQRVNIQLDGFPYQEFGIIVASVGDISLVPVTSEGLNEDYYLVNIQLSETNSDSLRTTYDRVIPFRQEMKGTANIITEDRKVMHRILDRIFNLVRNS